MYTLDDYDYTLPEHLIAQTPSDPPESCKLLVYNKSTDTYSDHVFSDIITMMNPHTLMIYNNSKVVQARLQFCSDKSKKQKEIFYLSSSSPYTFNALVCPGKKFRVWDTVHFNEDIYFTVDAITKEWRQLTCNKPISHVLEQYGQMPLPPYIKYETSKASSYQPIFACKQWSVAAPTASLHFTKDLLHALEKKGIQKIETTLHVGLGTFKQVDTQDIETYDIHTETIVVQISLFAKIAQQKDSWHPVLAIWTTVTRTLESLPYLWKILRHQTNHTTWEMIHSETYATLLWDKHTTQYRDTHTKDISIQQAHKYITNIVHNAASVTFSSKLYLYPWKPFFVIDQLITNFHLPKSSLLMLIAAYIWYENMKKLYSHAIEEKYKFYSFGDAMWVR